MKLIIKNIIALIVIMLLVNSEILMVNATMKRHRRTREVMRKKNQKDQEALTGFDKALIMLRNGADESGWSGLGDAVKIINAVADTEAGDFTSDGVSYKCNKKGFSDYYNAVLAKDSGVKNAKCDPAAIKKIQEQIDSVQKFKDTLGGKSIVDKDGKIVGDPTKTKQITSFLKDEYFGPWVFKGQNYITGMKSSGASDQKIGAAMANNVVIFAIAKVADKEITSMQEKMTDLPKKCEEFMAEVKKDASFWTYIKALFFVAGKGIQCSFQKSLKSGATFGLAKLEGFLETQILNLLTGGGATTIRIAWLIAKVLWYIAKAIGFYLEKKWKDYYAYVGKVIGGVINIGLTFLGINTRKYRHSLLNKKIQKKNSRKGKSKKSNKKN